MFRWWRERGDRVVVRDLIDYVLISKRGVGRLGDVYMKIGGGRGV